MTEAKITGQSHTHRGVARPRRDLPAEGMKKCSKIRVTHTPRTSPSLVGKTKSHGIESAQELTEIPNPRGLQLIAGTRQILLRF